MSDDIQIILDLIDLETNKIDRFGDYGIENDKIWYNCVVDWGDGSSSNMNLLSKNIDS